MGRPSLITIESASPIESDIIFDNINRYNYFVVNLLQKRSLFRPVVRRYCRSRTENTKSGATGEVNVDTESKFVVKEGYIVKKEFLDKNIFSTFYLPRLQNYCRDVTTYIKRAKKLLPHNFLTVRNCHYCKYDDNHNQKISNHDVKVVYEMENASYGKNNTDNFHEDLLKSRYSNIELESLLFQIHYIATVCNRNSIFHNDFKPSNIVINRAKRSFVYRGLDPHIIEIKKGDLIPLIIDYDLISFRDLDTNHPASGTSDDFFFFSMKIMGDISKKYDAIFTLPGYKKN